MFMKEISSDLWKYKVMNNFNHQTRTNLLVVQNSRTPLVLLFERHRAVGFAEEKTQFYSTA